MTLEQAIDRYTNNAEYERIHGSLQGCLDFRQLVEWLTDYKRLLEQQSSDTVSRGAFEQQPYDDAVSREAVLNLCTNDKYNIPYEYEDDKGIHRGYDEYRLINYYKLKQLPSVTPQKYGKWILADEQNKEDVENDNYRFICSECQCSDIHAKGTIVPYCWKCGAKMQESEDKDASSD